jgi:hypothetical protein
MPELGTICPTSMVNCPGIAGDSISWRMEHMKTKNRYSPEVRERAVRMVFEHEVFIAE